MRQVCPATTVASTETRDIQQVACTQRLTSYYATLRSSEWSLNVIQLCIASRVWGQCGRCTHKHTAHTARSIGSVVAAVHSVHVVAAATSANVQVICHSRRATHIDPTTSDRVICHRLIAPVCAACGLLNFNWFRRANHTHIHTRTVIAIAHLRVPACASDSRLHIYTRVSIGDKWYRKPRVRRRVVYGRTPASRFISLCLFVLNICSRLIAPRSSSSVRPSDPRLTDKHGYISDGAGNYSVGVKCSWLIDARDRRIGGAGGLFGGSSNQLLDSADVAKSSSSSLAATSSALDAMQATTSTTTTTTDAKQPIIRLHLEEFATECGWDHLYVYDGDSVESPLLAVFR